MAATTSSRESLRSAFIDLQENGRVPQSKIRELLSAAGYRSHTLSHGTLKGATDNDVIFLLRSLGHTDRAVADGKLSVSLQDVTPFFLSCTVGHKAPPNPLLVRAVIGCEYAAAGVGYC